MWTTTLVTPTWLFIIIFGLDTNIQRRHILTTYTRHHRPANFLTGKFQREADTCFGIYTMSINPRIQVTLWKCDTLFTVLSGHHLYIRYSNVPYFANITLNYSFSSVVARVSDPDPHGSALIWVAGSGSAFKLRIRIQEGKNYPQK